MNAIEQYIHDRDKQVRRTKKEYVDNILCDDIEHFTEILVESNYVKNFTFMGVPILQYPSDLMVMQEIIWKVKPYRIIETGVAFGGMTLFYESMMDGWGFVYGVDIDIREHTLMALEFSERIVLKQMDSTSAAARDYFVINKDMKTLVSLDSNHTHDHVLAELNLYAPLVSVGSFIVVFDTAIEFFGHLDKNQDRPWGKGNNPWTAVQEFLKTDMGKNFVIDKEVETRALITSAIDGWLRRVKWNS